MYLLKFKELESARPTVDELVARKHALYQSLRYSCDHALASAIHLGNWKSAFLCEAV